MLPRQFRNGMFERMSNKTMRKQFSAITKREATGLVLEVLEQRERDFFINGTITCHAVCPELMAGMWSGGREAALVDDQLPAWLKKAMGAELSRHNQCPYCGDMLVALTHGAKRHDAWRGGAVPLSRSWVEQEVADLDGANRDKARLALLVVKAPYQIDDGVIDCVLAHGVDEAGVIKLGAWAALSAARRVAAWTAEAALMMYWVGRCLFSPRSSA